MQVRVLSSSSSGNCALLETANTRILIDAGLSGRMTLSLLEGAGVAIESVDAVFLTHEHGDHVSGLRGLARFSHLKFFANYGTAQGSLNRANRSLNWKIFDTGSTFQFADLTIESHLVPHDALEPVGYIFRTGGDDLFNPACSVGWFTDLGHIPTTLAARLSQLDLLAIEANHCSELLEADMKRPWSVKQRIRGRHGHLSNQTVLEFLRSTPNPSWKRVLLGHLSKDCNCPHRLREAVAAQPVSGVQFDCLDPEQRLFDPIVIG